MYVCMYVRVSKAVHWWSLLREAYWAFMYVFACVQHWHLLACDLFSQLLIVLSLCRQWNKSAFHRSLWWSWPVVQLLPWCVKPFKALFMHSRVARVAQSQHRLLKCSVILNIHTVCIICCDFISLLPPSYSKLDIIYTPFLWQLLPESSWSLLPLMEYTP